MKLQILKDYGFGLYNYQNILSENLGWQIYNSRDGRTKRQVNLSAYT